MVKISPSILSANFSRLGEEIKKAEKAGADLIHVDVMDGHFVPNITIGPPVVKAIKKVANLPLDVHLMVQEPSEDYISGSIKAGGSIITVHQEACGDLKGKLELIKGQGAKAGVSIKPKTPLNAIKDALNIADMVLIMTVEPGMAGQKFMSGPIGKIKELRRLKPNLDIEVDGGMNPKTAKRVVQAGASAIVVGSWLYAEGQKPALQFQKLAQFIEI